MIVSEEESFSEILYMLSGDEQILVHRLYRLSDLTTDDLERFCDRWPQIEEDRRRIIVRHLADITEENFHVDFSDIFAFCLADTSAAVRMASLDGLWDTERLALISPILDLMESDPSVEVRSLAAATFGHFVLLAEWGQIPDDKVAPVIETLVDLLDNAETLEPVKRAAIESIGAATHPRVPGLLERAYNSHDLAMQTSSLFAMGRSADSRWLSYIIEKMSSPYEELRIEAARDIAYRTLVALSEDP